MRVYNAGERDTRAVPTPRRRHAPAPTAQGSSRIFLLFFVLDHHIHFLCASSARSDGNRGETDVRADLPSVSTNPFPICHRNTVIAFRPFSLLRVCNCKHAVQNIAEGPNSHIRVHPWSLQRTGCPKPSILRAVGENVPYFPSTPQATTCNPIASRLFRRLLWRSLRPSAYGRLALMHSCTAPPK